MKTEDVQKVANLARLNLTQTELQNLAGELTSILKYVESLNELDLKNIEPTAHAVKVDNVFRDDIAVPQQTAQDTLAQAPDHDDKFFLVPKVIG